MTKTWVYTGVLLAIAVLTAFLMRGVAQSVNQPGDLEIAIDSERYEEGDAVNFELRLAFAEGEIATTTSVRLTVDGPQSFSVLLPLKEGAHDLDDVPGLVGSLRADVQMSGVIDLSSASSTPTSIISVVLKGITQGASIDISARWLPDEAVDSVGDYTAQLLVQLANHDDVLVSPEIEFSIDAVLVSTPTPKATATSVNSVGLPSSDPTRTPRPTRTPIPVASDSPTSVATETPLNTAVAVEDTSTSISQADVRTAVVAALSHEASLRREAAEDVTVSQPSETPTRSTTIAATRGVSTSVVLRQSQRALPAKRSTPTPTHTSTTTPTTTPLAFVRVSSLRRFSATPARPVPAPTLEPPPTTQAGKSGIGAAGMMSVAVLILAINAVLIGLLTRLLPKILP